MRARGRLCRRSIWRGRGWRATRRRPYELGYNQVFPEPAAGAELGKREWGAAWPITRETVVSFLYRLHCTLHIPEFWGIDRWGVWLIGIVVALLSVTGVVIWLRKRKARLSVRRRAAGQGAPASGIGSEAPAE